MLTNPDKSNARERILETATELFFNQGYRATGINEVIARSGVAKATFYNHFPTKEDLCLAYLQERNALEYQSIIAVVNEKDSPRERFLAVMESIEPWIVANAMRGCAFLNMVAEVPDPDNRLRSTGSSHYGQVHDLIRDLAEDLVKSKPEQYASRTAEQLAADYMIILVGAIAMAEVYHDVWPVRHGIEMVNRMIE